eukprot:TRINITY_DN46317_c0_g1_i1.p1 TRINITY_DN46317_c0_g1~~TRINITY_DN46317_c0_g1_i1.p1  ORF type:complete len:413 (+),score=71.23 TRINITY_DN46317_c0_g1_i1:139-1239(+)
MEATRALLDSIMGTDRDAGKNAKKKDFRDDDVCKCFLVWECPHDMFSNQAGKSASKSPLGECTRQHSEALRERLKKDPDSAKLTRRYLTETWTFLKRLVDEVDVKSRREKMKLQTGASCSKESADVAEGGAVAREMLVKEKLAAAERAASEGDVELSQQIIKDAEKLAAEKKRFERMKEMAETWVDEICECCGRQISWRTTEEIEARKHGRPHPHEMGSWHEGWRHARESLQKLDDELAKIGGPDRGDRGGDGTAGDRDGRRKDRARDRDRDRDRVRSEERCDRRGPRRDRDRNDDRDYERRDPGDARDRREDDDKRKDRGGTRDGVNGTSRGEDSRRDRGREAERSGRGSGRSRSERRSRSRGRR